MAEGIDSSDRGTCVFCTSAGILGIECNAKNGKIAISLLSLKFFGLHRH